MVEKMVPHQHQHKYKIAHNGIGVMVMANFWFGMALYNSVSVFVAARVSRARTA